MHHCTICNEECDCDDVASGEGPCCHCDGWTGDGWYDGFDDGWDERPPESPAMDYLEGFCIGVIEREEGGDHPWNDEEHPDGEYEVLN